MRRFERGAAAVLPEISAEPPAASEDGVFSEDDAFGYGGGLDDVLGAYLVIGAKHSPDRVVAFLEGCSDTVRAEAISVFPAYFEREGDEWRSGARPTEQLVGFLHKETLSENHQISRAATRAIHMMKVQQHPSSKEG